MTTRRAAYLAAAVALLFLPGCASAPSSAADEAESPRDQRRRLNVGTSTVEMYNTAGVESRALPVSWEEVWPVLEGVYAQLEIPVTLIDPDNRDFGNPGWRPRRVEGKRLNTFIDCGTNFSGALANLYDVQMSVVTRLVPDGEGTRVVTLVDAFARPRTTSGNQVHCQSREILERRIVDLVAGRLGFGPGGR